MDVAVDGHWTEKRMSMLGRTIDYRRRGGEGEFCGVLMKIGWGRGEAPETNKKAGKRKGFMNTQEKGGHIKISCFQMSHHSFPTNTGVMRSPRTVPPIITCM